jgi:hypothetical protein
MEKVHLLCCETQTIFLIIFTEVACAYYVSAIAMPQLEGSHSATAHPQLQGTLLENSCWAGTFVSLISHAHVQYSMGIHNTVWAFTVIGRARRGCV